MLEASGIEVAIGGSAILRGVTLAIAPGEVVAVVGPNGAGKSTLLRVLSGALAPDAGIASLAGRRLADWPQRALARRRAVLSQESRLTFPYRVLEVVLLGRSPYVGETSRKDDLEIVDAAMAQLELRHLADRLYPTLSGGEKQRVQMARVLAQLWPADRERPDQERHVRYLLLDEPTSSLDLAHQHALLTATRSCAKQGVGVVAILHDLNLAAMHADRVCVLEAGCVRALGTPAEVVSETTISEVFALPVVVGRHPMRECPLVIPI